MSSIIPESPSPQLKLVLQYFEAWSESTAEKCIALTTEDLTVHIYPLSLNVPVGGRDELQLNFDDIHRSLSGIQYIPEDIIEGPEKIFVQCKCTGNSVTKSQYNTQHNLFFDFKTDDAGELKICKIHEFLDAKYTEEFFPAEIARMASVKKYEDKL